MAYLNDINDFLCNILKLNDFSKDYSNNGLQVEGAMNVKKMVFGVDASKALFEHAVTLDADMIFVHHGISWADGIKYFTGREAELLSLLFKNEISLYAAHLPLDAHPEFGHNARIAEMINLERQIPFGTYCGSKIGFSGMISRTSASKLGAIVAKKLNAKFTLYGEDREIRKIGIISGGSGSDGILETATEGLDCLITGEVGHSSWHLINELGICVVSCGHYKTEVPGVKAVMKKLNATFDIESVFIDIPTGL